MSFASITPRELHALRQEGKAVHLVDVRTPAEFRRVHAEGARSLPLGSFEPQDVLDGRDPSAQEPVYIICQSGGRSRQACTALSKAGLHNVVNVEGGTSAWERAGLPVVRDQSGSLGGPTLKSLAMLLVIAGLFLGWTISSWFTVGAIALWFGLMIRGGGCCCGTAACRPTLDRSTMQDMQDRSADSQDRRKTAV